MNHDSYQTLNQKILDLERTLKSQEPSIWGSPYDQRSWDQIHEMIKEISAFFKSVRYPTKQAREESWQNYSSIRDQAFELQKNLQDRRSQKHLSRLGDKIDLLYYSTASDAIVSTMSFGMVEVEPEEMKQKGRKLRELEKEFSAIKDEMTPQDKQKLFETIKRVRESHDRFWKTYKANKEKKRAEKEKVSTRHRNHLMHELNLILYSETADRVWSTVTAGAGKVSVDDMKWRGKRLKELGQEFKEVKTEMLREHKTEVFNMMQKVRASHDRFWGRYKEYKQAEYEEKKKKYEENQRNWEAKQAKSREVRARIENNLEKNRAKLAKAENALSHIQEKRRELQDKIYDSNSSNWKEKAYGWIGEFDDKIRDIEASISRMEGWIREDEDKLLNWR